MAEPTKLTTRIISKHITLEQANTGTWKPYEGEIVLARVDTKQTATDTNGKVNVQTVPTYLMKVGAEDDEGNLIAIKDLKWTHALAADVYDWAKQSKLAINDPDASDLSKNVITNIVATETGITITRASVATSDALTSATEAIQALQDALAQEVTDRGNADTALDNKITAINNNLDGTTEGGVGARLTAVEGVASGAASKASDVETAFNTYKNTTVPGLLDNKVDVSTYDAKMAQIDTAIGTTLPNAITEAANGAKSAVIGASGDAKTADTIYGAKAYADDAATTKANEAQSAAEAIAAGALATAKSELQGNIDTLSGTVTTNESANSTAHAGFNTRIETLEQKVSNVSTVMDFVGIASNVTVAEDGTITVVVDGVSAFQKGDVVASNDGKEYVYDGAKWHEFGYADDTEAAVANLKEAFETFRDTTAPATYATKSALEAETTARTTAIQEIDSAYKAADATVRSDLTTAIGTAKQEAYDDAVEEAARLDGLQTSAIETAYKKEVADAKTAIETAQAAIDAAQDAKITALEDEVNGKDSVKGLRTLITEESARADAAEKENAAAIKAISDDYLKAADKTELANATTTVANNLSTLSGTVTANKQDVDTNFVKVVDGKATVGGVVIIFDCGGAEEA